MKTRSRKFRGLTIVFGVLAGLGLVDSALAKKDKFTVECDETSFKIGESSPTYECKIIDTLFCGYQPKKPTDPDTGKTFPQGPEYIVDMKTFHIEPRDPDNGIRACPGWAFINGHWVYVKC